MFYTYAHYTPQGRLFYIGKGQGERAHSAKGRNIYWRRVVKKYGKPEVQILANWETEKEAFSHEVLLISCFKDLGHQLCNLTGGGEGSLGLIPWNKGKPWSDEIKAKQGVKNIGNKYWVGKKHSDKTIQKQKIAQTKYKFIGVNSVGDSIVLVGKAAMKEAGFVPTHIYSCANGLNKPHKGYIWVKEPLGSK